MVPILVLLVLAAGFAVFSVIAGSLTGPKRFNRAKLESYECGIEPSPQAFKGHKFPVKYYLTAMLFIVFDIEIIFLYPWAVSFGALGTYGFVAMVVFAAIVFISLLYEIAMGGLEWGSLKRVQTSELTNAGEERRTTTAVHRVSNHDREAA